MIEAEETLEVEVAGGGEVEGVGREDGASQIGAGAIDQECVISWDGEVGGAGCDPGFLKEAEIAVGGGRREGFGLDVTAEAEAGPFDGDAGPVDVELGREGGEGAGDAGGALDGDGGQCLGILRGSGELEGAIAEVDDVVEAAIGEGKECAGLGAVEANGGA